MLESEAMAEFVPSAADITPCREERFYTAAI